ncbi:LOW QUALITY PROTEIN: prostaglandin E synthase 3-like [Macrochelys suwanniensis]
MAPKPPPPPPPAPWPPRPAALRLGPPPPPAPALRRARLATHPASGRVSPAARSPAQPIDLGATPLSPPPPGQLSILCCLRKGESGQSWPRLTKETAKLNWPSVDFNNWKDWEDDSDEDLSNFDCFSEMMNNMGGDEDIDLPEVGGADGDSPDSDDEKMPDLE